MSYICDCQYASCPERHLELPPAFDELGDAIEDEDFEKCEEAIEDLNHIRNHADWPDWIEGEFLELRLKHEKLQDKYYCHYCDAIDKTVVDCICENCKFKNYEVAA